MSAAFPSTWCAMGSARAASGDASTSRHTPIVARLRPTLSPFPGRHRGPIAGRIGGDALIAPDPGTGNGSFGEEEAPPDQPASDSSAPDSLACPGSIRMPGPIVVESVTDFR